MSSIRTLLVPTLLCFTALFCQNASSNSGGGGAGAGSFISLDPLIVNLASPDDRRYLQVTIAFETTDPKALEAIKSYQPIIRSRTLLTLSTKKADEITTIEGKQHLLDQLLELARYSIPDVTVDHNPSKGVSNVHLTSFVIQ